MQARSAYISSLSTTAIMVASALLMLALLGAIVGFKGWPHNDAGASIDPIGVPVQRTQLAPAAKALPPTRRAQATAAPSAAGGAAPTAHVTASDPTAYVGSPATIDAVGERSTSGTPQSAPAPAPAPAQSQSQSQSQPRTQPPPQQPTAPTDQVRDAVAPVIAPVTTVVGPANAPSPPPAPLPGS